MRGDVARKDGADVSCFDGKPCKFCGLVVTEEMQERVLLEGLQSFPQCTKECGPRGVLDARDIVSIAVNQDRFGNQML